MSRGSTGRVSECIEEGRGQKSGSVHYGKEGLTPGWGLVGGKGKAW